MERWSSTTKGPCRHRWPPRRGVRGRVLRQSLLHFVADIIWGQVTSRAEVICRYRIANTVQEPIRRRTSHPFPSPPDARADRFDTNARVRPRAAPRRWYISPSVRGLDRHLTPTLLTSPTQCLSTTRLSLHSVPRGTSGIWLPPGYLVRSPNFGSVTRRLDLLVSRSWGYRRLPSSKPQGV